jgi:hypothetical protein
MLLNIKQMEMGYTSLDLAMLLIAAFVIWAASRVPVKHADTQKGWQGQCLNTKISTLIRYPDLGGLVVLTGKGRTFEKN